MSTAPTLRTLRSEEELDSIAPAWAALRPAQLDARPELYATVVRTTPEVVRPHVIVAERDGQVVGLLAARLETREHRVRFGYATVLRPRLRCLTVVCGGLVGDPATAAPLTDALLEALARREADIVLFHRLTVGEPLHAQAVSRPSALARQPMLVPDKHWALDLPDGRAALLPALPKKLRDNFKSATRKLERTHGERMEIRRYDRPEQLDVILDDLEAIARTTYQRGLGAGFDRARDRALIEVALAHGWFSTWVLYIDGAPVAFELGMRNGDTFVIGAKGYNPEFSSLNVGWPVQLRMLEDLADHPAIARADFGFGDADYKRRLATGSWEELDVLVHGRTGRAIATNVAGTAVLGADRLARRVAGPERVARLKRRWRTVRTPAGSTA
jgi:CelD/BcsL family acetyltransferase involved in cellulose biosynthesis